MTIENTKITITNYWIEQLHLFYEGTNSLPYLTHAVWGEQGHSSALSITGDTTDGSPNITNVTNSHQLKIGMLVTSSSFANHVTIESIDDDTTTMIVSAPANATVVGADFICKGAHREDVTITQFAPEIAKGPIDLLIRKTTPIGFTFVIKFPTDQQYLGQYLSQVGILDVNGKLAYYTNFSEVQTASNLEESRYFELYY